MQPKVSVLVPVYNVERYLEECLTSLARQTLEGLEIICINDGSTDKSLDILKEFASFHKNTIIIDKKNAGYGAAMNDGIDAATGEYFGIVEPDDYVLPTMFEKLYRLAKEYDLDLIKSDHYEFSGKSIDDQSSYVPLTSSQSYYGKVIDPSQDPSVFNLNMVTCTGIYKLDFVREKNIHYNETPGASYQDNGFWHQSFYFAHRVFFLDEAFYCYRQDNIASSTNSRGKALAGREEYAHIYRILQKHPAEYDTFIGMHTYRKFHNYLYNYERIEEAARHDFLKIFSQDFKDFLSKGEIDWSLFGPRQKHYLKQIIKTPEAYYAKDHGLTLVFATDDAYAPYAGVAIQSLIDCVDPSKTYSINILYTKLSDKNALRLLELAQDNVGISLVDVSGLIDGHSAYSTAHFSEAMYYRVLIPRLFPEKDKVLYLDCDVLVQDDVAKLFDIDLGSSILGAVHNLCSAKRTEYVSEVLGLSDDQYFNSGVILFNIGPFIANNIEQKCFSLISEHRNLECPDQDILNLACADHITWLPDRWNVAWQHAIEKNQTYRDPKLFRKFVNTLEDAAILHFTTGTKPWNTPDEPLSASFWSVARRTAFYETILFRAVERISGKVCKSNNIPYASSPARSNTRQLPRKVYSYYKNNGAKKTLKRILGMK